jgi:hypothetical protein
MNKENYHTVIKRKIVEKQRALQEKELVLKYSFERLVDHFTPGYMVKRAASGLLNPNGEGTKGLLKTGALVGAMALADKIFFRKTRLLTRTLGSWGLKGISRMLR